MPKGIILSNEITNPIPLGQTGIWNNGGNLIVTTPSGTVQDISTGASGRGIYVPIKNNSGSTISKGSVVSVNGSGELQLSNVSTPTNVSRTVGVASADILHTESGLICISGIVEDLTTSLTFGNQVYLGSTVGALYGLEPTVGVDGFAAEDYVVRIGVIYQDANAPGQKNLIVNVQIIGVL